MTAEFLMEWVCHNASRIRASASLGKSIEDWLHIELAREIQTRGWTPAAEIPLPVGKESVDLLYLVWPWLVLYGGD